VSTLKGWKHPEGQIPTLHGVRFSPSEKVRLDILDRCGAAGAASAKERYEYRKTKNEDGVHG